MKRVTNTKIFSVLLINILLFSCNTNNENKDTKCFCANKKFIPQSMLENQSNSNLFTIECEYYDNGKIKEVDETYFLDSVYSNQHVNYDTLGHMINDKSHLISLIADKDTIKEGEEYNLKIKLSASYFNSYIAVYIGNFNEKFILIDSNRVDTVFNDTTEVYYRTKKYLQGKNVIRGIVNDYDSVFVDDETYVVSNESYFSKTFYVLPPH